MFKFNAMSENNNTTVVKKEQPLLSPKVDFIVNESECKVVITYDFQNPANITSYMDIFQGNKSDKGNLPLIKEESIDFMGITLKIGGYVRNVQSSLAGWKQYLQSFEIAKNKAIASTQSEYDIVAKKYADCIIAGKIEESERHLRKLQELKASLSK
jgi:hypothetical protein